MLRNGLSQKKKRKNLYRLSESEMLRCRKNDSSTLILIKFNNICLFNITF